MGMIFEENEWLKHFKNVQERRKTLLFLGGRGFFLQVGGEKLLDGVISIFYLFEKGVLFYHLLLLTPSDKKKRSRSNSIKSVGFLSPTVDHNSSY